MNNRVFGTLQQLLLLPYTYKISQMEFKIVFIYKRNFLREQCLTRKLLGSSHFSCIKYGSRPCSLSLIFSFGNGGYNLVHTYMYYIYVIFIKYIYNFIACFWHFSNTTYMYIIFSFFVYYACIMQRVPYIFSE